jgi:ABC-type bacteriocin/lantibiotic exporter with double-glycine peptidase domain
MCRDQRNHRWAFFKVLFILLFVAAINLVLMLLWNGLMPLLFGIKSIDYLQAVGLLILSKILFSGIGMRHSSHYSKHDSWRRKFKTGLSEPEDNTPKE